MDASSPPPEAERELNELRRRAHGPHPDIPADPAALARLTELEAARGIGKPAAAADGAPGPDPTRTASREGAPQSLWRRLTATRARRSSFVAGALVVFFALAYTMASLVGQPRPDAILHPIADEADNAVFKTLRFLPSNADESTIRGYQPYRGVEPVFHMDRRGYQCLRIIERSENVVADANCVPPGVDLFADIGAWPLQNHDLIEGLPDGSIVRFHYRGHSVDVFLYPASKAD
ncbi:UNVERIFIED_ORG: hypothetical protein ABIB52_004405 [Arthrobacter sp. UYCu721]